MPSGGVLPSQTDETEAYRNAVARIILDIQAATGKSDIEVADDLDVSSRTIRAARNKEADLSPLYLTRLGRVYGGHFLNPWLALLGGHFAPNDMHISPELIVACAQLIEWYGKAVSADSPGGPSITHVEILEGAIPAEHVRRQSTGIVEAARKLREGR